MKTILIALLVAVLSVTILSQGDNCTNSIYDDPYLIPVRKGLTFSASEWPNKSNQWTGKMACEGCDPKDGDTLCTV